MIDSAKRMTLKKITSVGIGATVLATSANVLANARQLATPLTSNGAERVDSTAKLADFKITTRLSPNSETVQVTITNTSGNSLRITDLSPARVSTTRGYFDFEAVLAKGDVHLSADETIVIPMTPYEDSINPSNAEPRSAFLSEVLSRTVTVTTNNDSLASVSVINGLVFV